MSDRQLAPTRAEFKSLKECRTLGEAFQSPEFMDRIKQSAPAHVKPARMLRTFIQAASRAPLLLQCNMRSVLGAMLTCTEVGLEPNTPLQHAFLIPFGKYKWNSETRKRELEGYEVQLIFGYPGLLDLSYRSGHVVSVHADVVWPADVKDEKHWSFSYGTDAHLHHVPTGIHEADQVPVWAYAHANLTQGQAFEVLPWSEVIRIRNGSQGYQSAQRAKEAGEKSARPYIPAAWTEAPWVKFEAQMARKTAFRSLSKWLPKSVELAGALALDEQQDFGTVDFGAVIDGNASIMDGGLPEGEPAVDADKPDPTAAFTDRRPDPTPPAETEVKPQSDPKPARQSTRKQAAPPAEPAHNSTHNPARNSATPPTERINDGAERISKQPGIIITGQSGVTAEESDLTPPMFAEWLVDGEGHEIPDEDGMIEAITDPVRFAQVYVEALANEFPGHRELMAKANHDALARAMAISIDVAPILNAARKTISAAEIHPVPEGSIGTSSAAGADLFQGNPPVDPNFVGIPPLTKLTKAVMEDFNKRLAEVLTQAATPDAINHVIDLNAATYEAFPPSFRLAAKGLIEARQKAISPPPPRNAAVPDDLETLARDMAHDVYSLVSLASIDAWEKMPKVMAGLERLDRENPTLYSEVTQSIRERKAELGRPPEKTLKELADEMTVKGLACQTVTEIIALGRRDIQFVADAKRLMEESPVLWGEVKMVIEQRQRALTEAGAT